MQQKKNIHALLLAGFVIFMLAFSYAAVPLYKLFCQVTGYGGTPSIKEVNISQTINDNISIRFDSSIEKNAPVYFEPVVNTMDIKIGENNLAFYKAINNTDKILKTMSVFNVTPLHAGKYFNKIECFCFEEQLFNPGDELDMPVTFFIDPAIKDDKFIKDLREITLSYTMFIKKNNNE